MAPPADRDPLNGRGGGRNPIFEDVVQKGGACFAALALSGLIGGVFTLFWHVCHPSGPQGDPLARMTPEEIAAAAAQRNAFLAPPPPGNKPVKERSQGDPNAMKPGGPVLGDAKQAAHMK
ncbi:unnamed protein product [Amoebophrya sp. A25]|nr:unnamed protein product [Amoebophrya sp. A25]|eukprot:GSA25T00015415001.1